MMLLLLTMLVLSDTSQQKTQEDRHFSSEDLAAAQEVLRQRSAGDKRMPSQGSSAVTALHGLVTAQDTVTQGQTTLPKGLDTQILQFKTNGDAYMRFHNESGKEVEMWIDQVNLVHFQPTSNVVVVDSVKRVPMAGHPQKPPGAISLMATGGSNSSKPKRGKWYQIIEDSRSQALQKISDAHSHMAGEAWGFAFGSGVANALPSTAGAIAAIAADIGVLTGWWARCEYKYNCASDVKKLLQDLSQEVESACCVFTADMMVMRIIPAACKYLARAAKKKALGAAWACVNKQLGELDKYVVDCFKSMIQKTPSSALAHVRPDPKTLPHTPGAFDFLRHGWQREAAQVGERRVQDMEKAGQAMADRATGMVRQRVTAVLGEEAGERAAEEGVANFPIIGSIINGTIGLAMMRWSCGKVNDEFLEDYTRTINAVHDAVHDAIVASEVHNGNPIFLQSHLAENFGVDDAGACWESSNRGVWERWYMEKHPDQSSLGPAVRHRDRVYLKSLSDGAAKYLGVNSSGQMFMSTDKGICQAFLCTKEFCALNPDDDAELDTIVHDTDGIYLSSLYGQHHTSDQAEHPYAEHIAVDDAGKFCTSEDKDAAQCFTVQTARNGDADPKQPVWKTCSTCGGSGKRGLCGPVGFGWFTHECPTCHGKGGWME